MGKKLQLLAWGGVAGVLVLTLLAVRPRPSVAQEATTLPRYAYFIFCAGNYKKIDTSSQRIVAEGHLWTHASMRGVGPGPVSRFDGCLVEAIKQKPGSDTLYAAVPQEATEKAEPRPYWIVALQLPQFSVISKVGPFRSEQGAPILLLNPEGTQLRVQSDIIQNEQLHSATSRLYKTPNLEVVTDNLPRLDIGNLGGQWLEKGMIIWNTHLFDLTGALLKDVDDRAILPDAFQGKWREGNYIRTPITYADSLGGRMLFVAGQGHEPETRASGSGLVIYDALLDRTVSAFETPHLATGVLGGGPTVRLVPGKDLIVLEQYEWRLPDASDPRVQPRQEKYKTGAIFVYDLRQRSAVRAFQLDPVPGFYGRIVGFSPDGSLMYYGSRTRLYAVDLTGVKQPQALPEIRDIDPRFSMLVFADK